MHNYWIPVSDLLSGFVVVCLLMFVSASIKPQIEKRQQLLEKQAQEKIIEELKRKQKELENRPKELTIDEIRTQQFLSLKEKLKFAEESNVLVVNPKQRTIELKDISFQSGSACLSKPAKEAIMLLQNRVLEDMKQDQSLNIYFEGHTDPIPVGSMKRSCGLFETNTQLSTLRASNVRDLLIGSSKEYRVRMPVTGWGPDRLKDTQNTRNPINRRVELKWVWEDGNSDKED